MLKRAILYFGKISLSIFCSYIELIQKLKLATYNVVSIKKIIANIIEEHVNLMQLFFFFNSLKINIADIITEIIKPICISIVIPIIIKLVPFT